MDRDHDRVGMAHLVQDGMTPSMVVKREAGAPKRGDNLAGTTGWQPAQGLEPEGDRARVFLLREVQGALVGD